MEMICKMNSWDCRGQAAEDPHGLDQAAILLQMFDESIADWQSLTKLYGEMCDEELLELDAQRGDLTELAQQVLRDEMRKRNLAVPRPHDNVPKSSEGSASRLWTDSADTQAAEDETEESELPGEYTWKTLLCECNEREEVAPIRVVLGQAGIESWVEGPGSRYSWGLSNPRILVAADQLEQAREVLSQPIPQNITEECRTKAPEFEFPVCPECGEEDPVLESADPVNSWLCEECGKQWTDPLPG